MLILGRILAVVSALVLGAHFFRAGSYELVALALVVTGLVFLRRRWALLTVQAAMVLGAVEWLSTLLSLAAMRQAMGVPYGRMVAILALVAVVCLVAFVALTARRVREHFAREDGEGHPSGGPDHAELRTQELVGRKIPGMPG